MELFGFDLIFGQTRKGVKVPERKFTEHKKTEEGPKPSQVIIPLSQHIGAPCKPTVKMREEVKVGQVIGEPGGFVSAPIHSTVSGTVKKIGQMVHIITGRVIDTVIIDSDGKDEWAEPMEPLDPATATNYEITQRIKDAGIVGMGGATFPTHVKVQPPEDKSIDSLIINGCECEPYITSDHRLMLEHGEELIEGISILTKILPQRDIASSTHYQKSSDYAVGGRYSAEIFKPLDNIIIGVEDNKEDAIDHLATILAKKGLQDDIELYSLGSKYPMGAEKTLIKNLLDREVPIGSLPFDVGAIVHNVSTVKAIYDAVVKGRPLIDRIMTVTGAVKHPKNLLVRFGTPIRTLIDHCGGMTVDEGKVIFGGAMMGLAQYDLDAPVIKGTNCILVKDEEKWVESDCIGCSRCIAACPMDLMPTMYVKLVKAKKFEECGDYFIDNCVECGSCTYSCPAKIPLVQYIKVGKGELMKIRRRQG